VGGSCATHILKRALNLFGSDLSVSEDEAVPLEHPWKHSRESSIPKDISKPSSAKGIFKWFSFLCSCFGKYES
jgi:hypothetical protein